MAKYLVLWDGRREGPGGALLFADEQKGVPVAKNQRRPSCVDAVRAYLRIYGDATMRDIAHALRVDQHRVNGAIYTLRKQGLLEVLGESPEPSPNGRAQMLYTLTEAGMME